MIIVSYPNKLCKNASMSNTPIVKERIMRIKGKYLFIFLSLGKSKFYSQECKYATCYFV